MNRNNKKSSTYHSKYRNYSNKKPTKILIDSSKKVSSIKDEEKQDMTENKNESKKEEPSLEEQKQKRDKIIHENNLKVIDVLQKELDKIEKENELIYEEMNRLKEQEKELSQNYEKIRDDIEGEKDEVEDLKEINEEKNREYLQLLHLRHRQIMDNPITHSTERDNNNNNNENRNNINNNQRVGNQNNRFTLGDFMDGLLNILSIRRENENIEGGGGMRDSPFLVSHNRDNEDGPPMSYQQLQDLPSSSYPRNNNNNEKCTICGFDFCYKDLVTKLEKCNHTFHKNCLVNRLSARQASKCPTCRVSII